MSLLFIFFALPIATILLAIVLQKILKCPILVAITFFAIYLIASFVAFSDFLGEALIATIIYTMLAFLTAYITRIIGIFMNRLGDSNINTNCRNKNCNSNLNNNNNNNINNNENTNECCCNNSNTPNNLLRISYNCGNGEDNNLLTVNSNCGNLGSGTDIINNENSCCCNNPDRNIAVTANVVPCGNGRCRAGTIRGCYRRM